MPAQRSEQIEQLYHAARKRDPDERAAFLEKACAGDDALRREVESLLAQDSDVQSFLETPALELVSKRSGEDPRQSMIGRQLGPYSVVSFLAKGGMGEVYKARDTRLNRFVAIKVLPKHVSNNPELKARFEHEAQTLASLSHPHICPVFDVGQQHGMDYLVMEFLEGQTLAQRLEKGALPLVEALKIAIETADALDKAHKQSVIHRDVKPSNVMLTKTGVKLLDFGLAKLRPPNQRMTLTAPSANADITAPGTILGTLQYMSPEQLEGKDAQTQTDIFALGVVLYEMVTGKKAFTGESEMSLAAAILEHEPPPVRTIQPIIPPSLDHVVERCLAKRIEERWQSAGDVMGELKWVAGNPSPIAQTAATTRTRSGIYLGAAALLLVLSAAFGFLFLSSRPQVTPRNARFVIMPPENNNFSAATTILALSPDGARLTFLASISDGVPRLWVRPLDSLTAQPLPGTEGVSFGPFWSPDSRFIGFFAGGNLKKADATGGPTQIICDAPTNALGGTWNRDGVILFNSQSGKGLYRVFATGGQPTEFTKLDVSRKEITHEWPHFLPDGRHFLYLATSSERENWSIYVASLDSTDRKLLLHSESEAQYSEPGYLLFVRDRTLMAQQFDARKLEMKGESFLIAEDTGYFPNGSVSFSVSPGGVLADRPAGGSGLTTRLAWFNRQGKELSPIEAPIGLYGDPELSFDEKRLAVSRNDSQLRTSDIWLIDLVRNVPSRFTFDKANEFNPIWSPGGNQLAFHSDRATGYLSKKDQQWRR